MAYDERIIFAIEKHKPELLNIMKKIRDSIGVDLLEIEITAKAEETLRIEGSYPQLEDVNEEPHLRMEDIQNHLTAVYVVSFLVQELSNSIEHGEMVDSVLAGVSDAGAQDGMDYAIFSAGSIH